MASRKTGDWARARAAITTASKRLNTAANKAMLQEAHLYRAKMVEGIREQAPGDRSFEPLAPLTLKLRKLEGFKGTKALIRSGFLRNSITVVREARQVFIGVLRTTRAADGKQLYDLARIHEFGSNTYVVTMTAKMRKFLFGVLFKEENSGDLDRPFWLLRGSGKKTITMRIPPRPFIRPVFERFAKPAEAKKRIEETMAKLLKGYLAK